MIAILKTVCVQCSGGLWRNLYAGYRNYWELLMVFGFLPTSLEENQTRFIFYKDLTTTSKPVRKTCAGSRRGRLIYSI